MFNLAGHVEHSFAGMLVFSDVHGDYESFMRAYDYAKKHDYFFMSLGDLVDRGPFPFEVVHKMYLTVDNGQGGLTIGNHDDKFRRYANGSKVSFSLDAKRTLADVGPEREKDFLLYYKSLVETPVYSDYFHKFGDITLVHAASHPCMWENTTRFGDTAKSRALYGEVTGEKYEDGYPVRYYGWIDEVPMDKTVIVGHDRMPFNKVSEFPVTRGNKNGGKVVFMDTGCGKGGYLSAAVVKCKNGKFTIEDIVGFT